MPNVKISAAADAGTLLSSDMLPLARSGNTNAYHTTMSSVATFTNASLSSGAYSNTGRNLLHNPLMTVAQRGGGPFTGLTYTLDRWLNGFSADTMSVTQQPLADSYRTQIGDETAQFALANTFSGSSAAGAFNIVSQKIEDVRRLAGKTVTVSFWALCGSGTPKLGVNLLQDFGTGGSPSTSAYIGPGQAVTISTIFTRYSVTFTVPSVVGKTTGTNNNSNTWLSFWYSSGATNNANSGNVGVQSGTVWIWGPQVEFGSVATPLDYGGSPADQLRQCQRYYQQIFGGIYIPSIGSGAQHANYIPIPVAMRAAPTVTYVSTLATNFPATGTYQTQGTGVYGMAISDTRVSTGAGAAVWTGTYSLSADL